MRILVVGAGAIGGFFGGRLLQAGCDVTFLVRPRRAADLASAGLVIKSPLGDFVLPNPPTVQAGAITGKYDLVLLSCKAFDLEDAMASFGPGVGDQTAILPLLNGMAHLDVLAKAFGAARVLGGQCQIAVTLNEAREIVHLTPMLSMSFGERDGSASDRITAISAALAKGDFSAAASDNIMQEMWEKWVFLATLAGATSAMRGPIGAIIAAPGGRDFILGLRDEVAAVATAEGFKPRQALIERSQTLLTQERSPLTASMYRDIKNGAQIEADHVIGDLVRRADALKTPAPKLRMIYTNLKTYEAQRGK